VSRQQHNAAESVMTVAKTACPVCWIDSRHNVPCNINTVRNDNRTQCPSMCRYCGIDPLDTVSAYSHTLCLDISQQCGVNFPTVCCDCFRHCGGNNQHSMSLCYSPHCPMSLQQCGVFFLNSVSIKCITVCPLTVAQCGEQCPVSVALQHAPAC
jgi:hypothetical protein